MHYSVQYGHIEILWYLLKNKADPTVKNSHSLTPVDLASELGIF